jgi:DNA-binding phage protein
MVPTAPRKATMARKHGSEAAPDPENDAYYLKLSRLLDAKRNGRSDYEIAETAGMTKQAFSRLMNGRIPDPRLSTITDVLKAIGATLCEYEKA